MANDSEAQCPNDPMTRSKRPMTAQRNDPMTAQQMPNDEL